MVAPGAVTAGKAFVELGAKGAEKVKAALESVGKAVQNIGRRVTTVGKITAGVGSAITGSLLVSARQFASFGDDISKMAIRTGISTESLSEFSHVLGLAGSDLGDFERGVKRMQKTILDASDGLAESEREFDRLGISLEDLRRLRPEQQFELVAKKIAEWDNASERAAIAQNVLGRAGTRLLPMLMQNADAIAEARDEARRLGLVIDRELSRKAVDLTDDMFRVKQSIKGASIAIGRALAPQLIEIAKKITGVVVWVKDWIEQNPQLVRQLFDVATKAVIVGTALIGIGKAIGFIGSLMSPGGVLFILIATLIATNKRVQEIGKSWLATVGEIEVGGMTVKDIFDALKIIAGDIWTILRNKALDAFVVIEVNFLKMTGKLVEAFGRFVRISMDMLADVTKSPVMQALLGPLGARIVGGAARGVGRAAERAGALLESDLFDEATRRQLAAIEAGNKRQEETAQAISNIGQTFKGVVQGVMRPPSEEASRAARLRAEEQFYEDQLKAEAAAKKLPAVDRVLGTFSGRAAAFFGRRGVAKLVNVAEAQKNLLETIANNTSGLVPAVEGLNTGFA